MLLISKSDLNKHEDFLSNEDWQTSEYSEAYDYVKKAYYTYDVTVFKGYEIILCQPEFSKFNSDVRTILDILKVEYSTL